MKTEMQDLIEMYNKDIVKLKEDFKQTTSIIIAREISTLEHVVTNLESRLVKEKQQIVDSYNKGKSNVFSSSYNAFWRGEDYFNDKYKNVLT